MAGQNSLKDVREGDGEISVQLREITTYSGYALAETEGTPLASLLLVSHPY